LNWNSEIRGKFIDESVNGRIASDLEEKLVKTNMQQLAGRKLRRLFRSAGRAGLGLVVLAGLTLSVAQAQPANDNFANAINLTSFGDTGSTTGSNVGATIQPGEQTIGAFAGSVFSSVWYSWTASTNETTEFDPTGSFFGTNLTMMQVFTTTNAAGAPNNLQWVAYAYYGYLDGTFLAYSNYNFQAVAGQTYYISVAGYGYQSATGSIQLNWSSSLPIPPPPNDNFASATVLTGDWGSTSVDNSTATHEPGEPSIAGFPPNASVWYQWTAQADGEVTLDTVGNSVDTVLAVYTGTSLATLNQVAANDDLFPVNSTLPDVDPNDPAYNESWDIIRVLSITAGGTITTNSELIRVGYFQPYYGPSGLRFNAKAGTTYYFAVDTKSLGGPISLNWAYKSSGVFRWATEDTDYATGVPVYRTSDNESVTPTGNNNTSLSVVSTYYSYNAPGALVTVTRTAGSSGRALVDYTTADGDNLPAGYSIPFYVMPAHAGINYAPVSGTLIFDDFEMSKTILIPINGSGDILYNSEFGVVLSNPRLDPYESSGVSQPRVDSKFNFALVKILNSSADPYGPDYFRQVTTNGFMDPPTNSIPILFTNYVVGTPTNAIFNFEKANYRVPADVNGTNSPWAQVTLWVERFGTNTSAQTINYRVNNFVGVDQDVDEEENAYFPLQPGSDYAVPTPPPNTIFRGRNPDFVLTKGTISFPASPDPAYKYQPLTFTVPISSLTKFNKDFKIQLFHVVNNSVKLLGMNAEATVTILYNDLNPPAGSVDELYNADFNGGLALPPQLVPQTWPVNNLNNPGVSGQVYGLAVWTNDETIIAGNFASYNGFARNNLALLNTDGSMDTSFNPGDSANAAINAVTLDGNQFVIGGAFTAYNDSQVGYFARLNADGSLDSAFSTSQGSGANKPIRAMAVQPDGKVVIGGDFTQVDGVPRNYLARLNADGSLDTTFDPGNTLMNGSVYALALPQNVIFKSTRVDTNSSFEDDQVINLGPYTSGTLTINYNNFNYADIPYTNVINVFYGGTNTLIGAGVSLGAFTNSGVGTLVLPFAPTPALATTATNQLIIVMNQFGVAVPNPPRPITWNYTATVTVPGSQGIMVGGQFNVAGQAYANIARFTANGLLDTAFNPGTGPDDKVLALAWQVNAQVVAGGVFTHVNGSSYNRLVRFNGDGSIDVTNFFVGTGADDVVYNVTLQPLNGLIYVGGQFSSFNGTHRLGFTRLYANGTVDTTFMDTAYNQFAGLKRLYSYELPGVYASGIQSDGNVMIGGSFDQVGGGQADPNICNTLDDEMGLYGLESFADPNLWVEPKTRDGVRNRSSIARLIGGSTPGPGNLGMLQTSFSANKSQSSLSVGLVRTNGNLGPISANFSVLPGLAQSGSDYFYTGAPPMFWIDWIYRANPNYSRMHEDGLSGINGFLVDPFGFYLTTAIKEKALNKLSLVNVSIIKNTRISGNLNAQFQLANPAQADQFYLGGENIPLGGALGTSLVPLTIVDDTQKPGVFGFSSSNFIATSTSAPISVLRSNGVAGSISVRYSTISSNSTAVVGVDYVGLTNAGPLVFNQGVVSNGFVVTVKDHGIIYTNMQEKTVYLALSALGTSPPGATYGISNAILRLINPNYQGYVTLAATNFNAAESSGSLAFIVNRVAGSLGSVSVQYATTDGPSATNGVDYTGSTNTLSWNSGDVSQKTISVPLIQTSTVGANRQFGVSLFNPMFGVSNAPSLMGGISNATLTIINDNSSGALQFSAPTYTVNENGGYATLTVVRTGGTAGTISAHYATSDGTAVAGTNYVAVSGTVTLASGQIVTNITVPILDDSLVDSPPANFYFNVSLQGPGTFVNAAVHIVDAESYNRPPGSPDTAFIAAGMNGSVFTLALQPGGQILAGGSFTAVGTQPEGGFARLNPDGTLDTSFLSGLAGANGSVQSIVCQTDGRILLGGSFGSVNGVFRNFIARVMTDGSLDTSFNPGSGADNVVNAVAETFIAGAREIYVGGAFGNISGSTSPSPGIARLNNDGSFDASFSVGSGADGAVFAIAAYPTNSLYAGKVLIGGTFKHFNGMPLNGLARLNVDGSLDTNFNANFAPGADGGAVRALAIQLDGRVLVGGSFTHFNGAPVNHLVRLNTDGTVDTSFVGGTSGSVEGIALQPDNRIVLVGQFTQANGVTRNHITRLLPTGATDPTINFGDGANGDVDTVVVQPADGMLLIGGNFNEYDDQPHANIARIYGGSVTGSGQFQFTSANYQVHEAGAFAQITIRRTGGTSGTNADNTGDVFIHFATTNVNSAVAGVNYTPVNEDVDFPAGEVLRTVVVPVMDDFVITSNLLVGLVLSSPTPVGGLGNQQTATLTILEDDNTVSFLSTFYSVLKNAPTGVATIDVVRQGGTSNTCTVDFYTTTNGTAIPVTDYTPVSGTVTFNPGDSDKTFQIPINNNGLAEGNQTVGLALTNAVNTLLVAPSNATLTIIDTTTSPGRLSFSATNYVVNSTDANASVTVVRTNGSVGSVSVSYATVPGTALPSVNYNSVSGSLTFGDGETVKTILVPLVTNNLVQPPVNFSVVLSNPTGGATLIAPTNATVTIINNNFGVAFLNGTNYVSETSSPAIIFVQRIGNPAIAFQVNYATTNGTALAGINYTATTGTLSFVGGEILKTISVSLINNQLMTDLAFGMSLSSPTAGAQLVAPSNTVIVLQAGAAGLSFTNPAMSVSKDVGIAIIPVVCSNPGIEPVIVDSNTVPLSVQYFTFDGTAVSGQDYTGVSGTLVFTNGMGTNNIRVPISNNSLITGSRTFTVVLTNATAPGKITSPSNEVVTIIDNNSGLSFSSPVYNVLKTGVAATITVIRTDDTNKVSTVDFATANGTAIAPGDYTPTNGTCIFTNGVTSQTFTVTVIAGNTVQPDKTVLLQLSNPSVGSFLAPPSAATLTIHDTSGSLVVPAGSTLVHEGLITNGIIDPGETVTMLFAFRAEGGTNIANLYATLLATNGVTPVTPPPPGTLVSYGPLTVGGPSASRAFSFTANGTNGQQITATFVLNNGVTNLGIGLFTYTLGTWTTVFDNTNAIIINAAAAASPYPSAITVSNLGGVLIKAVITLTNMTHTAPAAINALLVSPNQNDTLFMSHAGGGQFGGAINGVTLIFDDAAANLLPFNGQITNGVYKPTQYGGAPVFP
jgi:uncharacterized delta-60 repeat protein